MHAKDIVLPKGLELITDGDAPIVTLKEIKEIITEEESKEEEGSKKEAEGKEETEGKEENKEDKKEETEGNKKE